MIFIDFEFFFSSSLVEIKNLGAIVYYSEPNTKQEKREKKPTDVLNLLKNYE